MNGQIVCSGVLLLTLGLQSFFVEARDFHWRWSRKLSSDDFLFRENSKRRDSVFNEYREIRLGLDLGTSSDCGSIDVRSTLRASLTNILSASYFSDMGKEILGASPMLAICYTSASWCSLIKNFRLQSQLLLRGRQAQCAAINKYVDARAGEHYKAREQCFMQALRDHQGNAEKAMQACGKNFWDFDVNSWAGGRKVRTNQLIQSSAEWAGLTSDAKSQAAVDLVKGLVGDYVIDRGRVSVQYGSKKWALTPSKYLINLKKDTFQSLCVETTRVIQSQTLGAEKISQEHLDRLNGSADFERIDRRSLRYLALLPLEKQRIYCRRLASSLAQSRFAADMSTSLDTLTVLSQNPNLPEDKRQLLNQKRKALKDQIDNTLATLAHENDPVNEVSAQIAREGKKYLNKYASEQENRDASKSHNIDRNNKFFDCADGVFCRERSR